MGVETESATNDSNDRCGGLAEAWSADARMYSPPRASRGIGFLEPAGTISFYPTAR